MKEHCSVQLALPKGRIFEGVTRLFADAGCPLKTTVRDYRPQLSVPGFSTKILKPQGIVEMLNAGRRDLGFAGLDWVSELNADVIELLDTGLDPVRVVAAAPESLLIDGQLPNRPLIVASEYTRLAQSWIEKQCIEAQFVRSWGATEVLPPEDADCVIDNTATGSTLSANRLKIVDTLMYSSTRIYASKPAMDDPWRRDQIENLVLLLKAVLDARKRVMLEFNVNPEKLEQIVTLVPAMRKPTVAALEGKTGFAVKSVVPRECLAKLIPQIKQAGASDIVVSHINQVII